MSVARSRSKRTKVKRRGSSKKPRPEPTTVVGKSPPRLDGLGKARGSTRYVDDLALPHGLVGYVVTSRHAHAEIESIDVSEARAVPGVVAVVTADDVPGENQIGVIVDDQPLLVVDRVRSLADRIALIAACSREAAASAAALVRVVAKPLPGVFDPVAALDKGAPKLHPKGNLHAKMISRKGDLRKARKAADIVVENTYTTGHQEHAYLETNGIIAEPVADGGMLIKGSMQCPFYAQKSVARVLGVPHASVRAVQIATGGGFGGKEDYPSELAACAALLARVTGRPVRLVYRRDEDFAWSSKRHATVIKHALYAKNDGTLLGMKVEIYVDAGAYGGLSKVVAERANASAGGPYAIEHVEVDTYVVYTCNPFGGAFRGFGAPQVTFALESQIDALACRLGTDPGKLRFQNFVELGGRTPTDEVLEAKPWAAETLEIARRRCGWSSRRKEVAAHNSDNPDVRRGIGTATMSYGCCLHAGGQHLDGSASLVQVHPDGSVSVSIGGTEIGQGAFQVMAQLCAETLGVTLDRIRVTDTDTLAVPDSGPTVASRTTIMSGNAVLDAARQIRSRLIEVAADELGSARRKIDLRAGRVLCDGRKTKLSVADLIGRCYVRKVNLTQSGWYAPPPKTWNFERGRGQPYTLYCYATMIAEVSVDTVTGLVTLDKMTAVHDVGRAIFPAGLEGQIQGGIVQGMGYATMEHLAVHEGRILNPGFTDYLLPTSLDVPEIDIALIEEPYEDGPYGAKGIGEPSLIPVAAAIANAVADALGFRLYDLPLTPERVKMAWEAHVSLSLAPEPVLATVVTGFGSASSGGVVRGWR
ncbi:MAG: xanthine dehydrogenase family protein molybdopterin-binding subunit [Myxococcota bacterium]